MVMLRWWQWLSPSIPWLCKALSTRPLSPSRPPPAACRSVLSSQVGSMQGLVHCLGDAVNTTLKIMLRCGSSVDGWPVSCVLLNEPRTGHSCMATLAGWEQMVSSRR